jgi:hypothetical protein
MSTFKLKKTFLSQICNSELLEKYNAFSVLSPEHLSRGYMVKYQYNTKLDRLQAVVAGDPQWTTIVYYWTPFSSGSGTWRTYEKRRKFCGLQNKT